MPTFLRLLLIFFFFTVVRYILRQFIGGQPQKQASGGRNPAPGFPTQQTGQMIRDPVCGTFVAQELSVKALSDGQTLYFCSPECRDEYLVRIGKANRSPTS